MQRRRFALAAATTAIALLAGRVPRVLDVRQRFLLAPCSNGHIALMVALARHNGWHWDAVLGAELAQDYKPQPVVYQAAVAALGCAPEEVLMVAAHTDDLLAAAAELGPICNTNSLFGRPPLGKG